MLKKLMIALTICAVTCGMLSVFAPAEETPPAEAFCEETVDQKEESEKGEKTEKAEEPEESEKIEELEAVEREKGEREYRERQCKLFLKTVSSLGGYDGADEGDIPGERFVDKEAVLFSTKDSHNIIEMIVYFAWTKRFVRVIL